MVIQLTAIHISDESMHAVVEELRQAWEEGRASGPGSGADLDAIIARAREELAKTLEELT